MSANTVVHQVAEAMRTGQAFTRVTPVHNGTVDLNGINIPVFVIPDEADFVAKLPTASAAYLGRFAIFTANTTQVGTDSLVKDGSTTIATVSAGETAICMCGSNGGDGYQWVAVVLKQGAT